MIAKNLDLKTPITPETTYSGLSGVFDILGLGPTLKGYRPSSNKTVGVNDIWKYYSTDYIVCIDPPKVFSRQRQLDIMLSNPAGFYSHRPEWQPLVKNFRQINISSVRSELKELDHPSKFCYSNNSAFVATILAYKLGAKKIILYGVDFTGHHALSREHNLKRAINDFDRLGRELKTRGVALYVSSGSSKLSEVLPVLSAR